MLKEFVYAENTRYSLRKHFSMNLQLLTFKVIENTSKTGEHYIASDRPAYWKLFGKALGGGIIVAFLCANKTRLYFQHLPIFWEAFFYSLNYAFGFMLIHVLGFIIATKQPAMTASTIAANLSNNGENPNWLESTTHLSSGSSEVSSSHSSAMPALHFPLRTVSTGCTIAYMNTTSQILPRRSR